MPRRRDRVPVHRHPAAGGAHLLARPGCARDRAAADCDLNDVIAGSLGNLQVELVGLHCDGLRIVRVQSPVPTPHNLSMHPQKFETRSDWKFSLILRISQ